MMQTTPTFIYKHADYLPRPYVMYQGKIMYLFVRNNVDTTFSLGKTSIHVTGALSGFLDDRMTYK